MNVSKTAVYLLLVLLVTAVVPVHVWGQSGTPGTKLRASVLRDTETMVASASRWRYHEGEAQVQCTPNGIPALELVSSPRHGTVRFVDADLGISFGPRSPSALFCQSPLLSPRPSHHSRPGRPIRGASIRSTPRGTGLQSTLRWREPDSKILVPLKNDRHYPLAQD